MSVASSTEYKALKWASNRLFNKSETQPVSSESDITATSSQIKTLTAAGAITTIPATKKTAEHSILQTHAIAITPAGLVVDRADKLACKVIVDTIPPYRLISGALEPLRTSDTSLSTKPWVQSVDSQIEMIDSNIASSFATIDDTLDQAERELKILSSDLSKPPREIDSEQCSDRIETIKYQLKEAATSIGRLIAVYGNDHTTEDDIGRAINNRIQDFNKLFKEGHRLNQEFEKFKRNNLTGLDYLLNKGSSVGKSAGSWYLSGGWSRSILHATPYLAATSNYLFHTNKDESNGWISPETLQIMLVHGGLALVDTAIRSIICGGILYYNRGKVDIFDFGHLNIASASASGVDSPGRMIMVQRRAFAKLAAQRTLATRTIHGVEAQIGQLKRLQNNLKEAHEQLEGGILGLGKRSLSETQIYEIIDDLNLSINALLEENLEKGDGFLEMAGEHLNFSKNTIIGEEDLTVENLEFFEKAVAVVINRIKATLRPSQTSFRAANRQITASELGTTRDFQIPLTRKASTGLVLKKSFGSYNSTEKTKYFHELAQKVKKGQFYDLDSETANFLRNLCNYYKSYEGSAFQRAIITEYNINLRGAPTKETLKAFESAITPYRT